jgi:hypothetical protein
MVSNADNSANSSAGEIGIGILEHGPHADLIRGTARLCYADERIQAIWVGGSLAAGRGDIFSDVDFRIAVEPGQVDGWTSPDWERYLPLPPCGGLMLRFSERALLHHMVLADGTIVDFYVQDTTAQNHEPDVVILACRSAEFRATLEGFVRPAASLVREIDAAATRQFFVDYWITTHKEAKALARQYDEFAFTGLYLERLALLRALYMQVTANDIDSRVTLHMLGAMHKGLEGKLTGEQHTILGLPSRTPGETAVVIEAIRAEMARVGRLLAGTHGFGYPVELEEVVLRTWEEHKAAITRR